MKINLRTSVTGFTIVELIVGLVLVGVIAAVTFTRFLGSNAYNARTIQDQVISLTRIAQQHSLGRSDVDFTITPNAGGTQVTLATSDSGGTIASFTTAMDSVDLSGDVNTTSSCDPSGGSSAISSASPFVINFGELGDLEDSGIVGSEVAVTSAVRICINDSAIDSVCVSPAGFGYAGDCDD